MFESILIDATNVDFRNPSDPYKELVRVISELFDQFFSICIVATNEDEIGARYLNECNQTSYFASRDCLQYVTPNQYIAVINGPTRFSLAIRENGVNPLIEIAPKYNQCYALEHGNPNITYVVLSEFHKSVIESLDKESRIHVIPAPINGEVLGVSDTIKVADRYLYLSRPELGLHYLHDIWPLVYKERPCASLLIGCDLSYIATDALSSHIEGERARKVHSLLQMPGVTHNVLTDMNYLSAQKDGGMLVYPCDPIVPTEFYGITVLECLYTRTPVLCSNADALDELYHDYAVTLPISSSPETWATMMLSMCNGKSLDKIDDLEKFNSATYYSEEYGDLWQCMLETAAGENV